MDYQKADGTTGAGGGLSAFYAGGRGVVRGLTVDMEAAPLAAFPKRKGLKFYPAMI